MAITKTLEYRGLEVIGAYIRVKCLKFTSKTNVIVRVEILKDKDSEEAITIDAREFTYELNGDNPFVQAYNHLKSIDRYADAVDC